MAVVSFSPKLIAFFTNKKVILALIFMMVIIWILTPSNREENPAQVQFVEPVFRRHFNRVGSSEDEFCLVNYNILGDPKVKNKSVRGYLPLPREDLLKKPKGKNSKRHLQLMKELRWLQPDILNLQEVELFYFAILVEELGPLGFEGLYSPHFNLSGGIATFYKTTKFKRINSKSHDFHDLLKKTCNEEVSSEVIKWYGTNRVVNFVLLETRDTKKRIVIGDTHIMFSRWNFPDAHALQIASFFQELNRFLSETDRSLPWIFTGDFNTYPHFPVYDIVSTGKLQEERLKELNPANYKYPQVYKKNKHSTKESIIVKGCRDKLINPITDTRSAYKTILGKEPPLTHYQIDSNMQELYGLDKLKGTLDYIWYSGSKLNVNAILEPVKESVIKPLIACPNNYFPSDHMSLKACFGFKSQS